MINHSHRIYRTLIILWLAMILNSCGARKSSPSNDEYLIKLSEFGAIPNDGKSDRNALQSAIDLARSITGNSRILFDKPGRYQMNIADPTINLNGVKNLVIDGGDNEWFFQPHDGEGKILVGFSANEYSDSVTFRNIQFLSEGKFFGHSQYNNPKDESYYVSNTSNWLPIDFGEPWEYSDPRRCGLIELENLEFKETYWSFRVRTDDVIVQNVNSLNVAAPYRTFNCKRVHFNNVNASIDVYHIPEENKRQHAHYIIDVQEGLFENMKMIGDSESSGWKVPIRQIQNAVRSNCEFRNLEVSYCGYSQFTTDHVTITNYHHNNPRIANYSFDFGNSGIRKLGDIKIDNDGKNGALPYMLFHNGDVDTIEIDNLLTTGSIRILCTGNKTIGMLRINGWKAIEPLKLQKGSMALIDVDKATEINVEINNLEVEISQANMNMFLVETGKNSNVKISNGKIIDNSKKKFLIIKMERQAGGNVELENFDIPPSIVKSEVLRTY